MARLADLRLDESTWAEGSNLRRAEWRVNLVDLLLEGEFEQALQGRYGLLTCSSKTFLFEALDDDGYVTFSGRIERAQLAEPISEYLAIIRRLDDDAPHRSASWFEAVDMAKKVVHDQAGRVISRAMPELTRDFATQRRLFTLLFSLSVDTTKLRHTGHGARF